MKANGLQLRDLIMDFKLIKTGFGKKIDEVEEDHDDCHIN